MRKTILLYLVLLLISCGKDEVIIVDPSPPNEVDNLFEVNIVGFVTDEENAFIPDAILEIDGAEITTDETGFFYLEKVLVGKTGKVIQIHKDGYLPSIIRFSNHNSLEDIMMNLRLRKAPNTQTIGPEGGSVDNNSGVALFNENVLLDETDITFMISYENGTPLHNHDALYKSENTEFLLKSASIFIDANTEMGSSSKFTIQLKANKIEQVGALAVFHYDETLSTWKKRDVVLKEEDGYLSFDADGFGWWILAENVPAIYATVSLSQIDGRRLSVMETELTYGSNDLNTINLYTNINGSVSTYFPEGIEVSFSINKKAYVAEYSNGFDVGNTTGAVEFDQVIFELLEGNVFSCDFTFVDGYVAIISNHHRTIKPISEGGFQGVFFTDEEDFTLQFYSEDFTFLNTRGSTVSDLLGGNNRFFACSDLNDNMMVLDGAELIEDFEDCRVKVNPKETLVIGEREIGEVFLVSFVGDKQGVYNGLIYSPLLTETEVESKVEVNIILFDEIENKVGGFILTENISTGEEVKISFIGDIE